MLHVEVSTMVEAPPETVLDVYADWSGWPRLFPTIGGVRLLRREGAKLVLEVEHVEGRVINELVVRPPDTLELWEEKRRYDARFSNRFEAVPGGARFTARGDIYLKGWARLLQPFLAGYVRRLMRRLQLQPVKATGPRAALSVRLAARRSAVQPPATPNASARAGDRRTEVLGERLRTCSTRRLVAACARLRVPTSWDVAAATTTATLRSLAVGSGN
jgi:Polyketide cyclase / dehydrase and lipid transport